MTFRFKNYERRLEDILEAAYDDGYSDGEEAAEDAIGPSPVDGILDVIKYYRQQVQLDTTLADKTTAEVLADLAQEIDIKFGD